MFKFMITFVSCFTMGKVHKVGDQCSFISFHEGYGDHQINKIPNIIGYNMSPCNPLSFHWGLNFPEVNKTYKITS
jgi:hypothetical protein